MGSRFLFFSSISALDVATQAQLGPHVAECNGGQKEMLRPILLAFANCHICYVTEH